MPEMTPDQATFLLDIFAGTIKQQSLVTRNVNAAIPADQRDYKADEYSKCSTIYDEGHDSAIAKQAAGG